MSGPKAVFGVDGAQSDAGFETSMRAQMLAEARAAEGRIAEVHTSAMQVVTDRYKNRLRADIVAGGFYGAVKLSKTWQGRVYPSRRTSMQPAGFIFTNAETIIDAFTLGVTITAHNAQYLAIPEGPAKAIVRQLNQAVNRSRVDGRFADEAGTVQRVAAALGVERLEAHIDQANGRGVLVAAGQRLTTRGRRAKRQTGPDTVLFVLVKKATLQQRIQGRELLDQFDASFETDFGSAIAAQLGRDERG